MCYPSNYVFEITFYLNCTNSQTLLCFVEKCNFSVVMMETGEKYSCFRLMDGPKPICSSHKSTSSCEIHYRNGTMCLKWPADVELNCVSDSLETLNGNKCPKPIEHWKCSVFDFHIWISVSPTQKIKKSVPLTRNVSQKAVIVHLVMVNSIMKQVFFGGMDYLFKWLFCFVF